MSANFPNPDLKEDLELAMTADQKFNLWLIGAAVSFFLAVLVGVTEGPRWAVAPLVGITLVCCVGMINNAALEQARERRSGSGARASAGEGSGESRESGERGEGEQP